MITYVKTSVPRPAGNPGKGITPKDVLTLIDVDDLTSFPARDGAGVVLVGDIVVKPSAYSVDLYMTHGTVELASNGKQTPKDLPLLSKVSIRGIKERFANLRRTG